MSNPIVKYNPKIRLPKGNYLSFDIDNEKDKIRSAATYRNTAEIEETFAKIKIRGITINMHAARVKSDGSDFLEWGVE